MLISLATISKAQSDTIPPVVLDFQIKLSESALTDSTDAVFTLTYSEEVELVDTFIILTHYNSQGFWEEFEQYDATDVVVENNIVTVTPDRSFSNTGRYEFVVTYGSVKDTSENLAAAFTSTFLADEDAPEVIDLEIQFTENDLKDSASAVFTLTYSENIQLNNDFIVATHVYENGTWPEWDVYHESEVSVQGNVLTITPDRMFSNINRYELIVAWGAVSDLAGNWATSFTRVFKPDATPPEVIDLETTITETEFDDSLDVNFVLTFNEDVKLTESSYIVTHYRDAGEWVEYEILNDESIVVSGSTITLYPERLYYAAGSYELVVTGGSVSDLADNRASAYTNVFLLDTIAPKLIDVGPDLTTLVPTNATFTLTFDEDIRLADNFGFYTYYQDEASGEWVELERLTASQAVVNNNVVTFSPDVPLMSETRSQIILTASSVMDMQGNPFIYVMDDDTLTYLSERFWTAEGGVTVVTFSPAHQDTLTVLPEELTISFSEAITFTDNSAVNSQSIDSLVYLRSNGVDLEYEASYNTTTNAITIVPAQRLAWETDYTYGFTDGFLNEAMDSIPPRKATFTIPDSMSVIDYNAIAEIHGDDVTSPYLGQEVQITGTVTAVYADEGFFVQDENAAKGGIWVEYADAVQLEFGDGVTVAGTVEELNGVTSLVADEVVSVDAPLTVEPIVVNFDTDSIPMYRDVVVQVADARASAANNEGEWMVFAENDIDSVIVSSHLYAYSPVADNSYDVTGVVSFRDSIYRIDPRVEADIVDVTTPTSVDLSPVVDFNVYPNPFANYIKVSNNEKLTRVIISNITGQRVVDVTNPDAEINTSHLISGVYIINMFNENKLVKTSRIVKQ